MHFSSHCSSCPWLGALPCLFPPFCCCSSFKLSKLSCVRSALRLRIFVASFSSERNNKLLTTFSTLILAAYCTGHIKYLKQHVNALNALLTSRAQGQSPDQTQNVHSEMKSAATMASMKILVKSVMRFNAAATTR